LKTRLPFEFERVALQAIDHELKRNIVIKQLARYGKSLSNNHLQRILISECTDTPLYLCTVVNELRLIGEHEKITQVIESLLACRSIETLFQLVLLRLEREGQREAQASF
jgi:hypothetical protein